MRKTNKSALASAVESYVALDRCSFSEKEIELCVIDGGYLLHRVVWPRLVTYQEVIQTYVSYVLRHYGEKAVVFDGYDEPTTKEIEQARRSAKASSPDIVCDLSTTSSSQAQFLGNKTNKGRFIKLLSDSLTSVNVTVYQAPGDADTLIVSTAVQLYRSTCCQIVVVSEDTDILALLIANIGVDTVMLSPGTSNKDDKVYSILEIQNCLGEEMCRDILFLHAMTGCDSHLRCLEKARRVLTFYGKAKTCMRELKFSTQAAPAKSVWPQPGSRFF
jgi:hypothetical protein